MANPFQAQLLKAGLVSKKQASKVKRDNHINRKQNKGDNSTSEISKKVQKEQAAQSKRERELNLQRDEKKRQAEQKSQVRQLIEQNRLELDERGAPYNFVVQNKIKRIFVADEMIEQLSRGQLAIVTLDEEFEIVVAKVAHQIAARDKKAVVTLHTGKKD